MFESFATLKTGLGLGGNSGSAGFGMAALVAPAKILGALAQANLMTVVSVGAVTAMTVAAVGVSVTGAVFSDSQVVAANSFTSGTVDISASPANTIISLSGMAPGDVVTAAVTVGNGGSLELRYALSSVTSEDVLAGQLSTEVKVGVNNCTDNGFANTGSTLYGPGSLGSTGGTKLFGDSAQGADAGDRVIAANGSEELCIQVSLPLSTGNAFQGLSSNATLTFDAEQTTNN